MTKLPKHTWKYDEENDSFISIKNVDLEVGDIVIQYNPTTGYKCNPQYVTQVWVDEYKQRCYTSRNMEEFQ